MGATCARKILARASGKAKVEVGDVINLKPDLAMSHENASLVINQFKEIYKGTNLDPKVWDKDKIAIIFDHRVPAESRKTATNQKKTREFVREQKISKFHDIRGDEMGICHQILPESGYVRPGTVVLGTDSHTTTHGALGAFAFGIGATEMAAVWALGELLNVQVPASIKVVVNGTLPYLVQPKDVILNLIGKIGTEGANFKALEFFGSTIDSMPTSGRLTISNMSVEAGATAGIFPPDSETFRYLREVTGVEENYPDVSPDSDAEYEKVIEIDASNLEPQVAKPHSPANVSPVREVEGTEVDQVVLGSCTNGRLDDLETAANILRGKSIARGTRMIVFPASAKIYKQAMERGWLRELMDAGATIMNPGCGACLGVHQGALGDGEKAISTTNRNFKGRMGNPDAEVYLSSAATAAASALTGKIADPRKGD